MLDGRSRLILFLAAATLILLPAGCDNAIDPFAKETGLFSVYGVLTLSEGPHFIRVKDLNDPLVTDSTREIDATVTLESLADGRSETLTDSLVAFEDIYTHNFRLDMRLEPATTYRLTVERSDGAVTQSTATTPPVTEVGAAPVHGHCLERISVHFEDVPSDRLIEATIGYRVRGSRYWTEVTVLQEVDEGVAFSFRPEQILSNVAESQDDPDTEVYETRCLLLPEEEFLIAYTHFGEDWLNVNLPFDPLESWDVENGLGFLGALRRDTLTVPVDTSSVPQ